MPSASIHSPLCEVGIDVVANKMAPWGWALLVIAMVLYRYCIGLWPYSGESVPPMFGDYEAQRHWMEITTSLPIGDWYRNTTHNDLLYWGLDYPPLTAYVSYLCGKAGLLVEPASMHLGTSRGYESPASRVFMRLSVIFFDLIIYFPACYLVVRSYYGHRSRRPELTWPRRYEAVALLMVQPGLLLIDHGHFQYNQVSLGLVLMAVAALGWKRYYLSAVMFSCALNFKQIALYYSLAFFFTLLSGSIHREPRGAAKTIWRVLCLGVCVVAVFAVHFLPFCIFAAEGESCIEGIGHVISRVFPFSRGLFEDKVSNIWCVLDPVLKLRRLFDGNAGALKTLSATATLLLCLPSIISLMRRAPSVRSFLYALTSTSLAFFLCGFQVHEKSILFPVMSASVLILEEPRMVAIFIITATFSMYPLLLRDGLVVPYIVTMLAFIGFAWYVVPVSPIEPSTEAGMDGIYNSSTPKSSQLSSPGYSSSSASFGSPSPRGFKAAKNKFSPAEASEKKVQRSIFRIYAVCSFLAMGVLHMLPICFPPPKKYPDLYVLLLCAYCCAQFILAWAYSTWQLWKIAGANVGKQNWGSIARIPSQPRFHSLKKKTQ